jgi:hypothetical protein
MFVTDGGGFGETVDMSPGGIYLAVGAPTANVLGMTYNGSVSVYKRAGGQPNGAFALLCEIVSSNGLSTTGYGFGESVSFSKVLADSSIYLFIGDPASNGALHVHVLPSGECEHRNTITGFAMASDHRTGHAVTFDDGAEYLYVGAPDASNDNLGRAGIVGRLYVSTFCRVNRERHRRWYHYGQYSEVYCRDCSLGFTSYGGRGSCQSCKPKPAHSTWEPHSKGSCSWTCVQNHFPFAKDDGAECLKCSSMHVDY